MIGVTPVTTLNVFVYGCHPIPIGIVGIAQIQFAKVDLRMRPKIRPCFTNFSKGLRGKRNQKYRVLNSLYLCGELSVYTNLRVQDIFITRQVRCVKFFWSKFTLRMFILVRKRCSKGFRKRYTGQQYSKIVIRILELVLRVNFNNRNFVEEMN